MGRTSIKSKEPIPMPHEADGILHCYYRKDTTTSNTCTTAAVDNDTDRKSEIVQTALDCLAQSEEPTRHSSSPALTLIIRLKVAPQVHDQLQALQAYRSNLLHQRKHKQPQENNSNSNDNNANQDHEVLYRVLLEWFLSYQTPLPLRRAIQSNLEVLLQEEHESSSNDNNNNSFQQTQITVLSSLWTNQAAWQQPLHSLQEALNYGTTHDILLQNTSYVQQMLQFLADYAKEQLQPILEPVLNDYSNNKGNNDQEAFFVEAQVSNAIQLGVQWAGIVKTILSDAFSMVIADQENNKNNSDHRLLPILQSLQDFIWQLLLCRITPTDALSNLGMAYSRVLFLIHPPLSTRNGVSYQLQQIISSQSTLTSLTAIAIVQGMAAVVPIRIMLTESHAFQTYFQTQCRQADPGVRLAALKGIHTLVSRCLTRVTTTSDGGNSSTASSSSSIDREELQAIQGMIQGTLEIVLQAWENPPNRRLGNAIPSLFQKLVSLMQQVGPATNSSSDDATTTFHDLVKRLLAQPSNRKGRYKALETLLPIVGSRQMIALGGWKLMESLLEGIGDRNSHNAGTIADLWAKILSDLLQDMLQETYGTNEKEIESGPFSQKKASKKKRDYEPEQIQSILPKWLEAWVPSLASMLLSPTPTRRKQVAAFCLPRIMDMVGGRKRQVAAVSAFACLLKEVHKCTYGKGARDDGEDDDHIHRLGQMSDHALWASLEVTRVSHLEKLVALKPEGAELVDSIALYLPLDMLKSALRHFSSTIRLVAFQTIHPVVLANSSILSLTPFEMMNLEVNLWKEAFPYAIKSEGKEYKSSLLQCLTFFMDRLSNDESLLQESESEESMGDDVGRSDTVVSLPTLKLFVIGFLIQDVAIRQAGYPGSIAEKEAFSIELLDCILTFASRDVSGKGVMSKNGAVFDRRRRDSENAAAKKIIEALLGQEVIAALISLLFSMWDGTRSTSFRFLSRVVVIGRMHEVELPTIFTSQSNFQGMEARAVHLASSPRQREADTGARILAFLYLSLSKESQRSAYMEKIVDLLERRLSTMKSMLARLLSGKGDSDTGGGTKLPLSHGLTHSLCLMVEHAGAKQVDSVKQYEQMTSVFCQALQISLTVVADVKEGSLVDGMDEDLVANTDLKGDRAKSGTPLNVNTGAIGANGTFSSVKAADTDQHTERIAIQRVVMGAWLLTRETCASLAALLTSKYFSASRDLLNQAGMLLISTLTSLKHAGAAFAAHRALQQIAEHCLDSSESFIAKLPALWAQRLLDEISETEKVRDSTLRRSTGYALGFLAIMRSEMSAKVEPRTLCTYILSQILTLSLPAKHDLDMFLSKVGLSPTQLESVFSILSAERNTNLGHEMRSRVHALNILRLIILDAPLAKAVGPIIGDSLVAAIIGYNDDAWGVRNSSTMVFAAIMLRAIDADKNASNTDATSNNAITFGELFRSYPSLSPFLLSLLRAAAADQLETHHGIPPIFPILLLLSRVQPVANSGPESAEQTAVFIPGVFASLSHRNDGIRKTASLALINLCSGDHAQSPTSASAMFNGCHALLVNAAKDRDWNSFHGALLGLKELAQSFSGIGQTFREAGLNRYFLRLCMLKGSILEIPPLCLSVVLSILAAQPDCWNDVEEVCRYLVDTIEEVVNIEISGLSDLAATAANLLADRVAQKIWSIQLGQNDLDSLLTIVSKLMGCEVIDVRLHASKAMKKAIYDNIDQLLVSTEVSCDTQRLRLAAISRIFLVSLRTELQRDAGAHPPTLRRHSRCLLECVAAYERLSQEVNASPLARLDLLDEFQDTAESLMSLDQCTEDSDIRGETQLTGNSVELLSFAIADIIRHTETVQEDLVRKFEKFASLIKRLNDPSLSWRLRHSAAMSVYNSHLLGWNIGDGQQIDERMTGIKQVMLEEVLVMLQDSDPDVRRAAGQAAYSIHDLKQTGEKSLFPSVSQRVLEQTYDYAYQRNRYRLALKENRAYFEQLLKAIETRCEYFAGKLSILEGELRQTMASAGLDNLLNTGTVRKIFEDEVANPYEESALANQLAVRKLLDFEIKSETNNNCSASSAIFFQCEKVLRAIKENIQSNTDFLHDLTRSNSVFADIHSLLVATAAILFLFGGDAGTGEHLKRIANDILESAAAPTMHPCILKALNSLAAVEPKSLVSRKDIRECLFLIPGSLSTEQGK